MDKASEDYFDSRNKSTEAEKFSKGITREEAHEAKKKMKRRAPDIESQTEENVEDAKEWWDARK